MRRVSDIRPVSGNATALLRKPGALVAPTSRVGIPAAVRDLRAVEEGMCRKEFATAWWQYLQVNYCFGGLRAVAEDTSR